MLEKLTSTPLVFPGIVFGVAMIEMALHSPLPVYGTLWLIGFAFVIRYLPYGMRDSHAGVIAIHRELEGAASMAGVSRFTVLKRILVKLISSSPIAGWLFIFLIGARQLSIAVLLASDNAETISVAMFDQWINGASPEVAAMGVIWTAAMSLLTTAFFGACATV